MHHAYARSNRSSPASLAAAIGINAVVLAALFTAAPTVIADGPRIIELFTPTLDPVPDPLPPPPTDRRTDSAPRPADPTFTAPERIVELPDAAGPVTDLIVAPPTPPIPAGGTAFEAAPPTTPVVEAAFAAATPDPRFLDRFQPDYPPAKQRLDEEGSVRVRFLIGADGRVKAIEPVGDADPAFFAATKRQALSQWRFRPAMRGDVAEESWQTRTVRFELNS